MVRREVPAEADVHARLLSLQHRSAAEKPSGLPKSAAREVTPSVRPPARRPAGRRGGPPSGGLDLDFDVHAGGQIEALERVDRLGRVLDDVHQSLVDPHLEVLP